MSSHPARPLPFQPLTGPAVQQAGEMLERRVGRLWRELDPQAQTGVARWLQERVALICREPWWEAFRIYRQQVTGGLAALAPSPVGVTTLYDEFVAIQLTDPDHFRRAYPVADSLVATAVIQWVEAVAEWLHRLDADRAVLEETFARGRALGGVADVRAGLSDPHHHGRSALIVGFASGDRVVYKPRPIGLDVAFQALLGRLNEWGLEPELLTLDTVDRGGYGWVQWVAAEPCPDSDAASRFFQRAGALVAIVGALRARDQHAENLIASGEHPVLVDAEMLLDVAAQWSTPRPGEGALHAVGQQLAESVLGSAMLPGSSSGQGVDSSALGGVGDVQLPAGPTFIHVNTDRMERVERSAPLRGLANTARVGDVDLHPSDHAGALLCGFDRAYHLVREHAPAVRDWLDRLGDRQVRFVYRDTTTYAKVLRRSLSASSLRDGAVRETVLRQLRRPFDTGLDEPRWRPLCEIEENALRRLDIPLLSAGAVSGAVTADGDRTGLAVDVPPAVLAARRLEQLGDADLQRQSAFVRASLLPPLPPEEPDTPLRPASQEELTSAVHDIADRIAAAAIQHEDGSAAWFAYEEAGRAGTIRPMTYGLYRGADGVALFLAAAARSVGADTSHLARAATAPVLRDLAEGGPRITHEAGLGLDGIGGIVYSLAQLAMLLQDERYIDAARQAADLVDHDRLAADRRGDVISGAAGATLGLLSLHDVDPAGPGLGRAVDAGNHLLGLEAPRLAGVGRGGTGRAHALFRLHRATADPRLLDRAHQLVAAADARLEETAAAAPQLGPHEPTEPVRWCRGAAGLAVSRACVLGWMEDDTVRNGLAAALDAVERSGVRTVDSYCCGNAGSIDALVAGGREQAALLLAGGVLQRAASGGYRIPGLHSGADASNGAFLGLAGIGLAFLRTLHADQVPFIGAME